MIVRQCGSCQTRSREPCTQLVDETTPRCAAGHLNAHHHVRPVVQRPVSASSANPVGAVDELLSGPSGAPGVKPIGKGTPGQKPLVEATCYETIGYLRRNPLFELTHNEAVDLADLICARDDALAAAEAQSAERGAEIDRLRHDLERTRSQHIAASVATTVETAGVGADAVLEQIYSVLTSNPDGAGADELMEIANLVTTTGRWHVL